MALQAAEKLECSIIASGAVHCFSKRRVGRSWVRRRRPWLPLLAASEPLRPARGYTVELLQVHVMATTRKKNKKPDSVVIPDKLYFRIGEVSRLCQLPSYVLRFWETEFPHLKPNKSGTGQRMYRRRDVEFVLQIKGLLYEEGYTIAGAREKLKTEARSGKMQSGLPFPTFPRTDQLKAVRQELQELASMLAPKRRK